MGKTRAKKLGLIQVEGTVAIFITTHPPHSFCRVSWNSNGSKTYHLKSYKYKKMKIILEWHRPATLKNKQIFFHSKKFKQKGFFFQLT